VTFVSGSLPVIPAFAALENTRHAKAVLGGAELLQKVSFLLCPDKPMELKNIFFICFASLGQMK